MLSLSRKNHQEETGDSRSSSSFSPNGRLWQLIIHPWLQENVYDARTAPEQELEYNTLSKIQSPFGGLTPENVRHVRAVTMKFYITDMK